MLQNVYELSLPVNIESPHGDEMAPKGIDILTPGQCRAARAWLNWSAQVLADRANVHRITVQKFEGGKTNLIPATALQIRSTFEVAGIEFPDLETVRFPSKRADGKPSAS